MQITVIASQAQIVFGIFPAMFLGADVFNMKERERKMGLRKPAILSTVGCPPDGRALAWRHPSGAVRRGQKPACLGLENGDQVPCSHVSFIFNTLFLGEVAFRAFAGQFINSRLKLRISPQLHQPFSRFRCKAPAYGFQQSVKIFRRRHEDNLHPDLSKCQPARRPSRN